jgi:hypothetical protein
MKWGLFKVMQIHGRRAMARETSLECNVVGGCKYVVLKVNSLSRLILQIKSLFTARNTTVEVSRIFASTLKSAQSNTHLQNDSASSYLNNNRPAYISAERSSRPAAQIFAHG